MSFHFILLGAQVVKIHPPLRPEKKGRALYNGQSHLVELHGGGECLV
jgi:hypothetical protein